MEIKEAELGDEKKLAEKFWIPLAQKMTDYSELNKLSEDAEEEAITGFQRILAENSKTIFILTDDGEEIGYMLIEKGEKGGRKHCKYVKIVDLYVKKEFRSNGYGSDLVEKAREIAQEEDRDYLKVSAEWKNKRAREFYKENGFEEKQIEFVNKIN